MSNKIHCMWDHHFQSHALNLRDIKPVKTACHARKECIKHATYKLLSTTNCVCLLWSKWKLNKINTCYDCMLCTMRHLSKDVSFEISWISPVQNYYYRKFVTDGEFNNFILVVFLKCLSNIYHFKFHKTLIFNWY